MKSEFTTNGQFPNPFNLSLSKDHGAGQTCPPISLTAKIISFSRPALL